ncbi:hypothetical protein [Lentzea sp. NEAU-D7]|uniref:hypothetical protein n=1 Tax=Lentzea sp. NEAU-D7 TaxID=2994667 RepID=UPI00224A9318|nr:hypothetical protein [Lentzea sp. NEAU-D7]MCX2946769.1 hypothetical protein [Lentzea sp. NEAU-D7]
MSVVGDASPSELGLPAQHVKLVCTHNSARSQFAAALCKERSTVPVASAGTTPADGVHPRASKTSCGRALSQSPSATTPANSSAVASTTLEHAYLDRAGRVDRLHALAKVEGHVRDGKPVVLFLCGQGRQRRPSRPRRERTPRPRASPGARRRGPGLNEARGPISRPAPPRARR